MKARIITTIVLACAAAACAAENRLEPALGANQVSGMEDAVADSERGVRIIAETDAWTGAANITEEVTPLRLIIENSGGEPVAVHYEHLELVGPDGQRFRALPPFRITGEVPALVPGYAPVVDPAFEADRYEIAPYYAPAYPGATMYGGTFGYDPFYYDRYYGDWQQVDLPTPEMRARALPEGVIQPGGRAAGFVYFQKVGGEARTVDFRATLLEAGTENTYATLSMPFVVED